jgi:hypothetical protein
VLREKITPSATGRSKFRKGKWRDERPGVLHEMLPAAATAQGRRVLGHFNIETNKNEEKCSSSSVSL